MQQLSDLPNVGPVLQSHLMKCGINSPSKLQQIGAKEAFIRIRMLVDPIACLHMLYGLEGAIQGIRYTALSLETTQELKLFFQSL